MELSSPPARPALSPLAVERQAQALARDGLWVELCDFVLAEQERLGPAQIRPRTWLYLLAGALETGSGPGLELVLIAGMRHPMPPDIRGELAKRLAMAGHAAAAMAVLLLDSETVTRPDCQPRGLAVLSQVLARGTDPALRLCAQALQDRILGRSREVRSTQAPFQFDDLPATLPAPQRLVIEQPEDVPAELVTQLRQMDQAFTIALRRGAVARVRQYEDVFVNRLGQIWRADGQVLESVNRPLPPGSQAAQASAPEVPAAVAALETAGFYHWFAEWMPSLFWTLRGEAAALPYLLREEAPAYQRDLLGLLRADARIVTVGEAVRVGRLYLADRALPCMAHWGGYAEGFGRLAARGAAALPPGGKAARLYISRRASRRRPLEQEAELEAALARRGFRSVSLEDLPMAEQLGLIQSADVVASPHGAGLAHLLGERSGLSVFEILPVLQGAMQQRFNYARLSRLRGHRHALYLARPNPLTNHWSVDIARVAEAAERFADAHRR